MNRINGTSAQAPAQQRMASLYVGDSLPDAVDLLDQIHSAASEGSLALATTLSQDEIVNLLKELIFVAQETLSEIDHQQTPHLRPKRDNIVKFAQKR